MISASSQPETGHPIRPRKASSTFRSISFRATCSRSQDRPPSRRWNERREKICPTSDFSAPDPQKSPAAPTHRCDCSCWKAGLTICPEWQGRACPKRSKPIAQSLTSPLRRLIASWLLVCALAASSRMPATACQRPSDRRSALEECWAVGVPRHQKVCPADVQLIFPVAGRGRPRVRHVPDVKSRAAHAMLEEAKWQQVSWRRGTKGRLTASFAVMRVRTADGPPQRIGAAGAQHICRAKKPSWWATIAPAASGNTISRTFPPTRRSRTSPAPSRRAGSANRRISNSRRNSVSTISKLARGPGCIAMRS